MKPKSKCSQNVAKSYEIPRNQKIFSQEEILMSYWKFIKLENLYDVKLFYV